MQPERPRDGTVSLFLCGDVMTGRGIDQVLPHPSDPAIFEPHLTTALAYVELAERASGRIERPVAFDYIWGEALAEMAARAPDVRVINLETSVTTSPTAEPKGINYRMHPANVPCLSAARVDGCVVANNHVLDWGAGGLIETLDTLRVAGIRVAGAGRNAEEAARPAVLPVTGGGRVLVFAFASPTSGVPRSWRATADRPGVRLIEDVSRESGERIGEEIRGQRRDGDVVPVSVHWGGNWGYEVPRGQRDFAHALIDSGSVDVVHGHSSHHAKGIEVYGERLILYGCGDFIDDYEGISGYERYRADLVLAYFVTLEAGTGRLRGLDMVPFQSRRFRLERASEEDARWLRDTLSRECRGLGTSVTSGEPGALSLVW